MGHIYFIMGVSGSGKGTLISSLKKSDKNFHIPLSYKTREIRDGEISGRDSIFVSKGEFFAAIKNNEFLEYAVVHDTDYYGTKYFDVIDNGIEMGRTVIKELDINGLSRLRKTKPEFDSKYTTIFLNIPIDILKERIYSREPFMKDEELNRRINSAEIEEEKANDICDYIIDATKSREEVLKEVLEIITN